MIKKIILYFYPIKTKSNSIDYYLNKYQESIDKYGAANIHKILDKNCLLNWLVKLNILIYFHENKTYNTYKYSFDKKALEAAFDTLFYNANVKSVLDEGKGRWKYIEYIKHIPDIEKFYNDNQAGEDSFLCRDIIICSPKYINEYIDWLIKNNKHNSSILKSLFIDQHTMVKLIKHNCYNYSDFLQIRYGRQQAYYDTFVFSAFDLSEISDLINKNINPKDCINLDNFYSYIDEMSALYIDFFHKTQGIFSIYEYSKKAIKSSRQVQCRTKYSAPKNIAKKIDSPYYAELLRLNPLNNEDINKLIRYDNAFAYSLLIQNKETDNISLAIIENQLSKYDTDEMMYLKCFTQKHPNYKKAASNILDAINKASET